MQSMNRNLFDYILRLTFVPTRKRNAVHPEINNMSDKLESSKIIGANIHNTSITAAPSTAPSEYFFRVYQKIKNKKGITIMEIMTPKAEFHFMPNTSSKSTFTKPYTTIEDIKGVRLFKFRIAKILRDILSPTIICTFLVFPNLINAAPTGIINDIFDIQLEAIDSTFEGVIGGINESFKVRMDDAFEIGNASSGIPSEVFQNRALALQNRDALPRLVDEIYNSFGAYASFTSSLDDALGVLDTAKLLKDFGSDIDEIGSSIRKFESASQELAQILANGSDNSVLWSALHSKNPSELLAVAKQVGANRNLVKTLEDIAAAGGSLDGTSRRLTEALILATQSSVIESIDLSSSEGKKLFIQDYVIKRYVESGVINPETDEGLHLLYIYDLGEKNSFLDVFSRDENLTEVLTISTLNILSEWDRLDIEYSLPNREIGYSVPIEATITDNQVFLSGTTAEDNSSNIPVALEATAPDITDDIIADLVEEADPDDPVTPDPVLVGVFSGVNGTPSSNFVIQGKLGNITETSTGNASFEWPVDECISGCTVTGTTPAPEANNYQYLSWGTLSQTVRMIDLNTGIAHDIQQMRWLYGDATSSDYLNTRTGTASYAGQIYGDITEFGTTQYNDVTGGIGLSFNFSDDTLSGEGYFARGGTPQESFSVAGGLQSYGGHQYLEASLTGQQDSNNTGGLLGSFYGPKAEEIGGAIWYFGHDAAFGGIFVAQPGTFVMPDIFNGGTHTRISSATTPNADGTIVYGVSDTDATNVSGNTIALGIGGEVTKTETFSANGYSYSSWGKWTAPTNGNAHTSYAQSGYWSETQTTPASVVQNRTGTASYSGNIVGDFVTSAGVRDDARGLINIDADFSNQSVSGQFQFGHDCGGGSGPSGCNITSGVASFNEAINDYGGSGFGSHSNTVRTTGSGVVGIFAGPNAEEMAGTAWMNDNGGMYSGVFIAGQ